MRVAYVSVCCVCLHFQGLNVLATLLRFTCTHGRREQVWLSIIRCTHSLARYAFFTIRIASFPPSTVLLCVVCVIAIGDHVMAFWVTLRSFTHVVHTLHVLYTHPHDKCLGSLYVVAISTILITPPFMI